MLKSLDILMVGVGGQGTILASRIIAHACQAAGYDVKVSEIHGMAQRGGSVVTQVRMGERVYSPLIEEGKADIILAFEKLEGLRWFSSLKPGGTMLLNEQAIYPVPVLAGVAEYPGDIPGYIGSRVETVVVDANGMAMECGSEKAANVVLVGVLAKRMPIPVEIWQEAVSARVPPKFLALNRAAFDAGYQLA